ncbi:hypothetical protein HX858_09590 [Marine Group I thaumarchaeote]|uniref:Tail tube protein n=1 Tax=Marine Group I thaumarchaeote TaxID=2511932 RepID=A0A7K4MWU4_9ARCH|nr:hypothetical protein [Marine Group I thaumarchaeote]
MPKISDLSGVFKGGARPNRFQVRVTGGPEILPNMEFLCRSASQPASTLGEIQVPYHGRFYKIPGDRTFEDWTITIYNDENHEIRKALETWSHRMNNYEGNTTTDDISALLGTCTVKQQDTGGNELHGYILEG